MRAYRRPFICFITLVLFVFFVELGRNVHRSEYNRFSVPLRERKLMPISYWCESSSRYTLNENGVG
jgi:hypothetical protein